ncbi:MAG TPA: hypoxanthine phosphoribosyltransferase [Verrucomicrobiota bacterium]|nr:hypoxanthine phosphoribosyltransferase [Verrucomicrobiales bacterium]HRI13857.1 hypoxanthine phosphoribosyltransferase [Verrucomicrobiota bacterium]
MTARTVLTHVYPKRVPVLISAERLRRRVKQIANEITADYEGKDVVLVALLSGSVIFLADLIRQLRLPLRLDFLSAASYRGTHSGPLKLTRELKLDIRGRHVLVVDDILDTGCTLKTVTKRVRALRPASVKTCVLLDKPAGRQVNMAADYVGFTISNHFVVGYGLDYNEHYRNLPFVGVLPAEITAEAGGTRRVCPGPPPAKRFSRSPSSRSRAQRN